jgi:S-adenosylmethionine/arginine decarboxylase-like enzyme
VALPAGPPNDRADAAPGFASLVADFVGVPAAQLADGARLSGLMVAAAMAAGLNASGAPLVRYHADGGLTALVLLEGSHMALHTFPQRGLMLLDVLAEAPHDPRRALDVFARRLEAREVRAETRERG